MISHDANVWALKHHVGAPSYNNGRIVMMGDAAHATTPFQGQGAGQAIEDALTLKSLLAEVSDPNHLEHAFHAFDLARRARTESVVNTSFHYGLVNGMMAAGIGSDIAKMKEQLDGNYLWIWNRDLEDQSRSAVKIFIEAIGATACHYS
jgi:salicylate hydroxylase